MTLSVVICTCNRATALAEALRCLMTQDADRSAFEVLVINNGCTDATSAVVAAAQGELSNLREIIEPNPGQGHARVAGVRASESEWIAFVDDDNLLEPGWINAALRFAQTHRTCGVFGGEVVIDWESPPAAAVAKRAYAYAETRMAGGTHRLDGPDRWCLRGAGLVCRRSALIATGWLDWQANVGRVGAGTLAGDDTEIVMRVAREGWEVWYEPDCRMHHRIAATRISVSKLRALHRGFALADPLLLGFHDQGSLGRWAVRYAGLLCRRVVALLLHTVRGMTDGDARFTALLTLDSLVGNLRGVLPVVRLTGKQRHAWLGKANSKASPPSHPQVRVLHLHNGRDYGGLERLLFCLGKDRGLAATLEPVFGLGFRHRLAEELSRVGARVEILGAMSRRRFWLTLHPLLRLWLLLRRERFDAVVCHGSSALAFSGWIVRACGVPLVLWMHSDTKVRHRNPGEFMASLYRPDLTICNSAFTARSLPLLFPSLPPHLVLHCPVSPPPAVTQSASRRREIRTACDTTESAIVLILPSRLEEWKGHRVLLRALTRLQADDSWVCWIVGGPFNDKDEAFLAELRALVQTGGIAHRVRFLGQRADVPDLLAAADIFCQPNLTPEPFGVNAVEALYAGLPVVASDSGGTREIVDSSCGVLTPADNDAALAATLAELIHDPARRAALGSNASARAHAIADPARLLPTLATQLAALRKPVKVPEQPPKPAESLRKQTAIHD